MLKILSRNPRIESTERVCLKSPLVAAYLICAIGVGSQTGAQIGSG